LLNHEALKKDGKGCQTQISHEEDEDYARSIGIFPFNLDAAKAAATVPSASAAPTTDKQKSSTPDRVVDNCIEHTLLGSDTLQGLAIRYNTSVR